MQVTINCPMSHSSGWSCDGTLTVRVSGEYIPARGFDPPVYPEFEIVEQDECQCDPLAIDSHPRFDDIVNAALASL